MPTQPRRRIGFWTSAALVIAITLVAWWQNGTSSLPRQAPADSTTPAPAVPPPTSQTERATNRETPAESHDLSVDERFGGHTLARHVGKTDDDLRDRLRRETRISAASTYTDRASAERTVALALAQNARDIATWLRRTGTHADQAFDYRGPPGQTIGRSIAHGRTQSVPCTDATVVLRWTDGDRYFVLTSYPEARR